MSSIDTLCACPAVPSPRIRGDRAGGAPRFAGRRARIRFLNTDLKAGSFETWESIFSFNPSPDIIHEQKTIYGSWVTNIWRMEELVDSFGLETSLNSRFAQLSLGQQNRTNLTRYLLQDFDLLIMDESLANVDELTREKIILRIKTLYPQHHFLYISHNVIEVSKFCRHILVMAGKGRISPAAMVFSRASLAR